MVASKKKPYLLRGTCGGFVTHSHLLFLAASLNLVTFPNFGDACPSVHAPCHSSNNVGRVIQAHVHFLLAPDPVNPTLRPFPFQPFLLLLLPSSSVPKHDWAFRVPSAMGRGCCLLTACPFCIDRIALGVSVEYFFLAQKRETLSAKDAFSSSSLEVAMSVKLAWRITVSVPYILPHYLHALASGQEQGHPSLSQVTQGTPPTDPTSYPQNPNPLTGHATAIRGKQPLFVQVEQLWLCGYRFAPGRDSLPPERDW